MIIYILEQSSISLSKNVQVHIKTTVYKWATNASSIWFGSFLQGNGVTQTINAPSETVWLFSYRSKTDFVRGPKKIDLLSLKEDLKTDVFVFFTFNAAHTGWGWVCAIKSYPAFDSLQSLFSLS